MVKVVLILTSIEQTLILELEQTKSLKKKTEKEVKLLADYYFIIY